MIVNAMFIKHDIIGLENGNLEVMKERSKMSKSASKKKLEHLVRQGKFDPRGGRVGWGMVKPVTKIKYGTKKDQPTRDFGEADSYLLVI
jgi:hypothetical protein